MNAIVQHQEKAALRTGGKLAAIVPQNIDEAARLATGIFKSGMAPATLKTAEQVMVAIMAGAELGLMPFQAIQSFAMINNRPSLWGDGFIAVIRSHGFKVKEWSVGAGDEMAAYCEVTRPDTGEVIERSFSVEDARKANLWGKAGPWQQYPKRMLQMRARGFAGRDGAADVLKGFQLAEEVQDYAPVREVAMPATAPAEALQIEADKPAATFEIVDQPEDEPAAEEAIETAVAEARDMFVEDEPRDENTEDMFPGDRP